MNRSVKDTASEFPAVAGRLSTVPSQSPGYWTLVRKRLMRDPVTLIAAAVLVLIVLTAIFSTLLAA